MNFVYATYEMKVELSCVYSLCSPLPQPPTHLLLYITDWYKNCIQLAKQS